MADDLRFLAGFSLIASAALFAACGNSVAVAPGTGAGANSTSSSSSSGSTSSTTSTTGSGGGGMSSSGTGGGGGPQGSAEPPPPGPVHPGDGAGVVLAVRKLYLGDTDPDGTADPTNGWKHFGFDIDHKVSTAKSTDLCKPALGAAPSAVYPDGDNGSDNAFGKNILPILLGFAPDTSDKVNAALTAGASTLILHVEALGAASDYNPLVTKFYRGANLGSTPKFDGTDVWPVRAEDLSNPADIESALVSFDQSYVVSQTWVSGQPATATVHLALGIAGYALDLAINRAILAMRLAPDHKTATQGTIAGVLGTEAFIAELKKVAGSFDKGLCTGSTFSSIADQLRQASDILIDGTQDPSKTCDGISIGVGFEAAAIVLGPVAPPQMPPPDPCL